MSRLHALRSLEVPQRLLVGAVRNVLQLAPFRVARGSEVPKRHHVGALREVPARGARLRASEV